MERLDQSSPDSSKPLTPKQKAKLAEIDQVFKGKIAEREIFLKQKLDAAMAERNLTEIELIHPQIASERKRLEEECEAEKNQVRHQK